MTIDELVADLRKAAHDIATEGHNGWGNLCSNAADALTEIKYLRAELEEEKLQRSRAINAEAECLDLRDKLKALMRRARLTIAPDEITFGTA